jgi:hypothetical protein
VAYVALATLLTLPYFFQLGQSPCRSWCATGRQQVLGILAVLSAYHSAISKEEPFFSHLSLRCLDLFSVDMFRHVKTCLDYGPQILSVCQGLRSTTCCTITVAPIQLRGQFPKAPFSNFLCIAKGHKGVLRRFSNDEQL